MKYLILFFCLLLFSSCVSTQYNRIENQNDFSNVQTGTKYTVYDNENRKYFVEVTSVESDSIFGIRKNEEFAIAKKDIREIKKNKTGATIGLIAGSAAALGVAGMIFTVFTNFDSGLHSGF